MKALRLISAGAPLVLADVPVPALPGVRTVGDLQVGFKWIGGVIEPGQDTAGKPRRAVEIEPLDIAFEGDTLNIRA